MKKIITLILAILFTFTSLTACTNSSKQASTNSNTNSSSQTSETDTESDTFVINITNLIGTWMGEYNDSKVICEILEGGIGTIIIVKTKDDGTEYKHNTYNITINVSDEKITVHENEQIFAEVNYTVIDEKNITITYKETNITFVLGHPDTDYEKLPTADELLSESLIGSWAGTEEGVTVVYTFNEGGSGTMTAMGIPFPMTYEVSGKKITLTVEGFGDSDTETVEFSISGDTLTLKQGGETNSYTRQ